MRVETALEVATDIFHDFHGKDLLSDFDSLFEAMAVYSSQQNEESQLAIAEVRDEIYKKLEASRFNRYPSSLALALDEMAVKEWLGLNLKAKLEAAFQGNDLTPASAKERIKELVDEVKRMHSNAEEFIASAAILNLKRDLLAFQEYDFTIVVPRSFVNNHLDEFGAELKRLDRVFSVFNEIGTGAREDFKIKSIASSDLSIVLESAPATALLIVTALERLAAFYEKVLNIILLQRQVLNQDGMPEEVTEGMEQFVEAKKASGIDEIANGIEREFFSSTDEGRRNELRTELRSSLKEIAKRYDHGFLFDVRGGDPFLEEGTDEDPEKQLELERHRKIKAAGDKIRFFKGEAAPLLKLDGPDDNVDPQ